MDKLTAYQLLGLDSNASTEEVKEAYARLSKEYHPEENPEEFQQLHEAYVTLTRGGRRANRAMVVESSPIEKKASPEMQEGELVFRNVQMDEEEPDEEQANYDFDESISQAELDEIKALKIVIEQAEEEFKRVLTTSNFKNTDKFKEFFQRKDYEKVFYTREFVRSFTQHLAKVKLLPELYSYVIEFYSLKRISYEELDEDLQKLYQVIDRRYNVEKDAYLANRSVNTYAILAIITFVVSFNWNTIARLLDGIAFHPQYIITCVIPFGVLAGLGVCLYKLFRSQYSTYFAQAVVAVIYMVLGMVQTFIFQYLHDYTEFLVSNLPLSLSRVFIWANVEWLIIIGITAFMQSFRKKK